MSPRDEVPVWAVFPMVFSAIICLAVCILAPLAIVIEIGGHVRDSGWPDWITPIVSAPALAALWGVFGTAASFLFKELFS